MLTLEEHIDLSELMSLLYYLERSTSRKFLVDKFYIFQTISELIIHASDIEKNNRIPLIESFKKSKEKVLLASVSVANTSFSLNECSAAVYFENTWTYTDYFQSRGRIARIGKNEEVRYYQLCYNNSINQLQIDNLKTKGQTIENLIRKNTLTAEQWKAVFNSGTV